MTQSAAIRIVIADDHAVVREGLAAILHRQPGMKVVGQSRTWPEVIEQVARYHPEVAVVDLHMPGLQAAAGIRAIRERFPSGKLIAFSALDAEEEVYQALRAGAHGYVLKGESDRENLLRCIRAVLDGQLWIHHSAALKLAERMKAPGLTKRERDILQLVVSGKSNKEIGASLNVTEGTVKVHLNHIFPKLGVRGRVAAVGVAIQRGIAHLSGEPVVSHALNGKNKYSAV